MSVRDVIQAAAGAAGGPDKTFVEDVFSCTLYTGDGTANRTITNGINLAGKGGLVWIKNRTDGADDHGLLDTERGVINGMSSNRTTAQNTFAGLSSVTSSGFVTSSINWAYYNQNGSGQSIVSWTFRKAPKFFDVVTYTGNGVARTVNHNLGVAPELMIVKRRTTAGYDWWVYLATLGPSQTIALNSSNQALGASSTLWNNTAPTASVFSLGSYVALNASGFSFVSYLFASCPGVSKVGSYTGNGSSQTINCGFTNGARFVLIKRTDSTGDWYVWDTARGIVANNDPHLSLNTTAAEVTTNDTIDPNSTGFIVNQVAATNVNVSGASYIYLAIA